MNPVSGPGRPSRQTRPQEAAGVRLTAALRQARETAGLTRQALSHASGVPMSTLAKIEQSRSTDPGFLTVTALAEALGLDVAALATAVRPTPPETPAG